MKKLLFFASILFASCSTYIEGTYISDDKELSFTFVKDSLYIDMAASGCGVAAFKLEKIKKEKNIVLYNAYDTEGKMLIKSTKISKNQYIIESLGAGFHDVYCINEMLNKR